MSRNKILILILVIITISGIIAITNDEESELMFEETTSNNFSISKAKKTSKRKSTLVKAKETSNTAFSNKIGIEVKTISKSSVTKLINKVKDDSSECDNQMQDVFGSEEKNIDLTHYTEYEIREMFGKFNMINFSSSAMPDLMNELSQVENKVNDDEMQELSAIKPCRIFQKINFLDELRKLVSKTENDSFKKDITQMLFKFFEKEVSSSYSVANLTMTMNMLESFIQEGVLPDAERKSSDLEEIVDSLEQDYEEVLSRAEDSLENNDGESLISKKLIQEEIKLNLKYKKMLLDFIQNRL